MDAIMPYTNSIEIVKQINALLELLNYRNHFIVDYENPDMYLSRVEYHRGDCIGNEGRVINGLGDCSDNFYCFFEEIKK